MPDFEYHYDFSDQATMSIFDHSTYSKIFSDYEKPIRQLDLSLEANCIRLNEIQRKTWEFESTYQYRIQDLEIHPTYMKLLQISDQLEKENRTLRSAIVDLQKQYHDLVVRKYEDKTVPNWFDPIHLSVKDDLIVSSGLDIIGAQITNRSSQRWAFFHIGESGQGATMDQQELKAPIAAYPVSQIGSFTSVGDQIRFFGAIPSTLRSVDIREIGLSTRLSGGFLLNRSTYPENDPLKHIKDRTYPVATIVVYMTSDQAFSIKA